MIPGEIIRATEPVEINAGEPVTTLRITNTGNVPVHLTAHFHLFEANPRLRFDRLKAYGMRLDTHAKGSVRFEPGESKDVNAVPIGGARIVHGFHGVVDGKLEDIDPQAALQTLRERGFLHQPEADEG